MTWASLPSWRTPGPVAIIVYAGVSDNMDQVFLGGESWCGPELTRLCGEGEGDCQLRGTSTAGTEGRTTVASQAGDECCLTAR